MSAWLAANRGDRQTLCHELDSGADMEFKDPMGRTALMEAAKHGHVACVQELLYRGADPTARSAVGWTAVDFCGSHESSHDEIHQLLGEAQQVWQENHQQQQHQQQKQLPLLSQYQSVDHSDKENTNGQLLHNSPLYSSAPSPPPLSFSNQTSARPLGHSDLQRQFPTDSAASGYTGRPPQQPSPHQQSLKFFQMQQQQLQQQPQHLPQSQANSMFLQSQRSFVTASSPEQLLPQSHSCPTPHSHVPPMLSQGMLAQATLARLSRTSTEAAISSVTSSMHSSMHSLRSSELSNVSNLSNSLLSSSLNSPFLPAQQSPATLSRPVCRYWHSGRCLYGAHCRCVLPCPALPCPARPRPACASLLRCCSTACASCICSFW